MTEAGESLQLQPDTHSQSRYGRSAVLAAALVARQLRCTRCTRLRAGGSSFTGQTNNRTAERHDLHLTEEEHATGKAAAAGFSRFDCHLCWNKKLFNMALIRIRSFFKMGYQSFNSKLMGGEEVKLGYKSMTSIRERIQPLGK